jgi:hypothetical protein
MPLYGESPSPKAKARCGQSGKVLWRGAQSHSATAGIFSRELKLRDGLSPYLYRPVGTRGKESIVKDDCESGKRSESEGLGFAEGDGAHTERRMQEMTGYLAPVVVCRERRPCPDQWH